MPADADAARGVWVARAPLGVKQPTPTSEGEARAFHEVLTQISAVRVAGTEDQKKALFRALCRFSPCHFAHSSFDSVSQVPCFRSQAPVPLAPDRAIRPHGPSPFPLDPMAHGPRPKSHLPQTVPLVPLAQDRFSPIGPSPMSQVPGVRRIPCLRPHILQLVRLPTVRAELNNSLGSAAHNIREALY